MAKAQKAILREFQRTLRFLLEGEMACFDAEQLLRVVGNHLSLKVGISREGGVVVGKRGEGVVN